MGQSKKTKSNTNIIAREERRRKVAQYMQQSMTEAEIAARLGVGAATVCRDIQALTQIAQDFVFSLAKGSLSVFYKDVIDDLLRTRSKAWDIYDSCNESREKLLALKIVIASNQSMFETLLQGPQVMQMAALEERLSKIESSR